MKPRRLYYRRKGKALIIEGKQDGKSVLIWTLPDPEKFINQLLEKSSLFPTEKADHIREKIRRLDYRADKSVKHASEVRTREITRTPKKDAIPSEEQVNKALWELTK